MDDNIQELMNRKSDNICTQDNTTASDDDAFMKYITNNMTTFGKFGELVGLQSFCKIINNTMTKHLSKENVISKLDGRPRPENAESLEVKNLMRKSGEKLSNLTLGPGI